MFKLLITEPWEFGTINGVGPFNVALKKGLMLDWLITFDKEIIYKEKKYLCLLSRIEKGFKDVNILKQKFNILRLEIAVIEGLNQQNFNLHNIENYRGEFLTGELST